MNQRLTRWHVISIQMESMTSWPAVGLGLSSPDLRSFLSQMTSNELFSSHTLHPINSEQLSYELTEGVMKYLVSNLGAFGNAKCSLKRELLL